MMLKETTSALTLALLIVLTGTPKLLSTKLHLVLSHPTPSPGNMAVAVTWVPGVATAGSSNRSPAVSPWWWLLLPIGVGGGVAAWWVQRRSSEFPSNDTSPVNTGADSEAVVDDVPPPVSELATRAESVISSDRISIGGNRSHAGDASVAESGTPGSGVSTDMAPSPLPDLPIATPTPAPPADRVPPPLPAPGVTLPLSEGVTPISGLGGDPSSLSGDRHQTIVEAAKFDVGQTDLSAESLADVDEGLPDLPEGYGESRIVLLPRDPQWAYAYWDIPADHKEALRQQGGERLALRFYDITDINLHQQSPHTVQQFDCDELARDWYIPVAVSDRDYAVEIGYLTAAGGWLTLARSGATRIPPIYPSDWVDEQFLNVPWDAELRGQAYTTLVPPLRQPAMDATDDNPIYEEFFDLVQSMEIQRVAGSLFGSMQMIPEQSLRSYLFPSGAGAIGMSGIGMSGIGFAASIPPMRSRKFWLVADAELIVYGATEPDAMVTIGDRPIQLNPDGTFRFAMSFQDGLIDYPIVAVAVDGEQHRSIHMEFVRETPDRRTNTKDEATDEPF